jgi:hypothetical protein
LPLSHGARRATPLHLIVKRDLAPIDEQLATLLALFRRPESPACAGLRANPLRCLDLANLQTT